jgi:hypothetical protein
VFDELDPGVADRRIDPPVPEAPPQIGQHLCVAGIAAVHLDEERTAVVGPLEQPDPLGLHRRRGEIIDPKAEVGEG